MSACQDQEWPETIVELVDSLYDWCLVENEKRIMKLRNDKNKFEDNLCTSLAKNNQSKCTKL